MLGNKRREKDGSRGPGATLVSPAGLHYPEGGAGSALFSALKSAGGRGNRPPGCRDLGMAFSAGALLRASIVPEEGRGQGARKGHAQLEHQDASCLFLMFRKARRAPRGHGEPGDTAQPLCGAAQCRGTELTGDLITPQITGAEPGSLPVGTSFNLEGRAASPCARGARSPPSRPGQSSGALAKAAPGSAPRETTAPGWLGGGPFWAGGCGWVGVGVCVSALPAAPAEPAAAPWRPPPRTALPARRGTRAGRSSRRGGEAPSHPRRLGNAPHRCLPPVTLSPSNPFSPLAAIFEVGSGARLATTAGRGVPP